VWDDPARVRGELLTEAQLLCHATDLARSHSSPTLRGSARPLRKRFGETRRLIRRAYATLLEGTKRKREPSPAELWLLDNSHVVEGQLREIDDDLPWGYLVELPRMSRGAMRGFPLVYGLCLDYLRHTDSHVDFDSLSRFVNAYQSERVLTIGELWAVPIMLRLGLIIAVGVLATNEAQSSDRDLAEHWASRILGPPPTRASELRRPREELQATLLELEELGAAAPPSDAFLVTLLKRLREREDTPSEALDWIALQTARLHTTPEELARRHHLRQAANQVSVGNAISSMRAINSLDWRIFFRRTSRVEAVLLEDPGDVYARMDDRSQDRCRHAIEKLARRSGRSEVDVASATLALAAQHRNEGEDYRAHVGYYLLDDGQAELHAALGYAPGPFARFAALPAKHPASVYLGSVGGLSLALLALCFTLSSKAGTPTWLNWLLLLPLFFAASEAALALVNAAVVALLPPRILAKFEFEAGIPSSCETLVVVPTLLVSPSGVDRLIEELEVRGLANPDRHLYFALLSDFVDADAAERPGERELVERARLGIERLNARHVEARYFLLHRRRVFDPHEGRYMGWERKRGKLAELNRLLRGAPDTSFEVVTAPAELLARIRYVITLDTDTELPLGVARRLVATIAHPLNRPWVDPRAQRVRRGHAIIQPRVGTSPTSARKSLFARLAAGPPGIDPYTTAVSDVYQDLFGEGSFVGKGIYDVDAFEAVMAGRVPDNQLLSHDLFESIYARAALASDIEVLDEQPASYTVAAGRQHRWIRGDWQLLPWLFPRVPGPHAARRYDFRAFDAWRVFDNLRRSLLAPALVALAVTTWFSGEASAVFGSVVVLAVYTVPVCGRFVFALARPSRELDWLGGLGGDLRSNVQQAMLSLVFVLDQAILHLDAVIRALYRQYVTRKRMLEWATMRDSATHTKDSLRQAPRLLVGSALASLLLLSLPWVEPEALPFAAPLLGLWLGAPFIARWVSRVRPEVVAEPWGPEDALLFRRIARKTWRFFERFVGDLDQHLPPDNYQEDPRSVVAHRTSPTNIGLYLLAVAAARDLGFISLAEAIRRWRATLHTIGRLEKREGHLLNWYDTTTLAALEPRYVSTVDSGNLAGYLWTLAEACRDMRDAPQLSDATLVAALDAARLARAAAASEGQSDTERRRVDALITELERAEAERNVLPQALPSILLSLTASFAASKQD
jgi:cyclic beta-1,2-glucan synthetase